MNDVVRERTFRWEDPRVLAHAIREGADHEWLRQMVEGRVPAPPSAALLGMQPEEIGDGRITFSMEAHEWMTNPAGVVHGGLTATLLDTVLTLAVLNRLPSGKICTTINLNVSFVRPLFPTGEKIIALGEAIHVGTTVATAEARVHDARERLIAHASATLAIIDIQAGAAR